MNFIKKESYIHLKAKEVLKEWIEENRNILPLNLRSNRDVFLEYPICKGKCKTQIIEMSNKSINEDFGFIDDDDDIEINNDELIYDSWDKNWDEINHDVDGSGWNGYIPTYEECIKKFSSYPIAIIDMVIESKGNPYLAIEIKHKNAVSEEKIKKLKDFGIDYLIEIDALWILKQIKIPKSLKFERLI
jgi:hypothetical protein